jgi:hypothetical protein
MDRYTAAPVIAYVSCVAGLVAASYVAVWLLRRSACVRGCCVPDSHVFTASRKHSITFWAGASQCILAGLLGSLTLLLAKSGSLLIRLTFSGTEPHTHATVSNCSAKNRRQHLLVPLGCGGVSVSCVHSAALGNNQLVYGQTYAVLLGMAVCAVSGVRLAISLACV